MEYPKCLEHVAEVIYPDELDFIKAIELSKQLYQIGKQIGAIDILIASMCINRDFRLITKDNGFKFIKEVENTFRLELRV